MGAGITLPSYRLHDYQLTDIGQIGGVGAALAFGTIYQAKSDGVIQAVGVTEVGAILRVEVDNSTPPTPELSLNLTTWTDNARQSACVLVKKNYYWKVTPNGGGAGVIYWTPMK